VAYNLKYRIIAANKNDKIAVVEMYIDEVVASVIEYPATLIQLEYIPRSDDIYEPIYASQLNVSIDVTDNQNNLPDFTTLNDRKYLVKLTIDGSIYWQGWVLSDNVQYSFTTGRKTLSFDAIDGLGMLDYIPFTYTETNVAGNTKLSPQTVLYFLYNCLAKIGFPTGLSLFTACSYYADGMQDRGDGSQYEPFNQSYLRPIYFQNDDETYQNCLEILTKILKSFGCKLYQSNGKWYIVAVNEFAAAPYYAYTFYTEYNASGGLVTSGTFNTLSEIQAYTGNTSGLYFTNNSQVKLFKKGYNNFDYKYDITYSNNYISNPNLKNLTSGSPTLWATFSQGAGGSVAVVSKPYEASDWFNITLGADGVGFTAFSRVSTIITGYVTANDKINYTQTFYAQTPQKVRGQIQISVTGIGSGAPQYYINKTGAWQNAAVAPFDNYYEVEQVGEFDELKITTTTINTPPIPVNGSLTVAYLLTNAIVNCATNVKTGSFGLTFESPLSNINSTSIVDANNQYKLQVNLPLGYPIYSGDGVNRVQANMAYGTILQLVSSNFVSATGWYRYGPYASPTDGLSQTIMKEYINNYRRNLINLDCNVFGITTSNGNFAANKLLKIIDTDPAQINIQDKRYMTGNMTIDIVNCESQATLLDISNVEISSTINTIFTVNGIPYN
jgi:hypothetical protein